MFLFSFLFELSFCVVIKPSEERSFLSWMRETKNFYIGEDYHFRFGVWLANYRYVQSKNVASTRNHFKCGMNSLSAFTPAEYKAFLGYRKNKEMKVGKTIMANSQETYDKINSMLKKQKLNDKYPDELDYRTNNPAVLNTVRNVGNCGGGDWAFSVIAAIESSYAIKHNELYKLSEQCLLDCVEACDGCNFCTPYDAFFYITNSDVYQCHINTESDYPWVGAKGDCKFDLSKSLILYTGALWGRDQPESDMISYLNDCGVGSLSMDASAASFQLYVSGVYDEQNCGKANNHAINVVGYGNEGEGDSAIPYWICRNSWGDAWGEEGYFRIIRGIDECGIAFQFGFPIKFF